MKYLIAQVNGFECWIDETFYYLTTQGYKYPSFQKKHTYDIPIQHIKLGELEGDGLALIHEYKTNRRY